MPDDPMNTLTLDGTGQGTGNVSHDNGPQAATFLRLARSDGREVPPSLQRRYRREMASATLTRTSEYREVATSRSVEYGMPVPAEISRYVMPASRSALSCNEGDEVMEGDIERKSAVESSAFPLKTDIKARKSAHKSVVRPRHTPPMEPRDLERERELATEPNAGPRIRYAMKVRGFTQDALAKKVGYKNASSLRSVLDGSTAEGKRLHDIAKVLRVSYDWIAFGKGDMEGAADDARRPAEAAAWPLPGIPRERLAELDDIELGFLQSEMMVLLDRITARRRRRAS